EARKPGNREGEVALEVLLVLLALRIVHDVVDHPVHHLVLHGREIDTTHVAVHPDHRGQSGGKMEVRSLVLDGKRQQFSDIHVMLPCWSHPRGHSRGPAGDSGPAWARRGHPGDHWHTTAMNGSAYAEESARRSLEAVRRRIREACERAGRDPATASLLAVGKTFPAERLLALAAAGQHDFGENYLQEALAKQERCAALAPGMRLRWHFIGPIQSNKTRAIAEHFDWVHSVDRERIARR